jgi:pentapeptide MXKDX repeat protein
MPIGPVSYRSPEARVPSKLFALSRIIPLHPKWANRLGKERPNEQETDNATGFVCSGELDQRFAQDTTKQDGTQKEETKQNAMKQDSMGKDEMKQDPMGNDSMKHDEMTEGKKQKKAHKSKKEGKKDAMGKDDVKHSDSMQKDEMQH